MKLKFPSTPEIKKQLAQSGVRHGNTLKVHLDSYRKFRTDIMRDYKHLSDEEQHALIVLCCMTHPDHKDKHRRIPQYWYWLALGIGLLLLLGVAARAQGTSQIDVITFQNSSGVNIKSFAAPFKIKCSTNVTCSASGSVLTVTAAGGAGGSGYSAIQNAGVAIAAEGAINFLGSFSCVDNPGNTSSDCKLSASAAVSRQFVTGTDSSGNYLRAQPAYSDISGTPQLAVTKTCTGTDKVSAYDSTTGLFTCSTDQTGAGGSTPTGTGFRHVTSGTEDGTAVAVDVSSADITGVIKAASFPALTGDLTTVAGAVATTLATVATPGTGLKTTVNAKGLVTAVTTAACADLSNAATSCATDATNAANIGSGTLPAGRMPAHTGDVTSSAGSVALTIAASAVTRADLAAGSKNWAFCGTANGATTTVGPVSAATCCSASTCREFMIHYLITGYSGSAVGRLLMGPGTPSTTALTNGSGLREVTTATATDVSTATVSIPGIPLAITVTAISRDGWIMVDGASGSFKSININGLEGNPSVSAAPTIFQGVGWFSDLSTNLPLQQFQLSVYATLATTSLPSTTFNSGTRIDVWGRNGD